MTEFLDDNARLREAAEIVEITSYLNPQLEPTPGALEKEVNERNAVAALLRAVAGYYDPYSWPCMWMSQSEAECPHCAAVSLAREVLGKPTPRESNPGPVAI